jgi:probable F420-dependent oxidoreductase
VKAYQADERTNVKIGLLVGSETRAGKTALTTLAINAERLGFNSLWTPEHVVLFDEYASVYPYTESGRTFFPATTTIMDPFVTLMCAATVTSTIRLATAICLVPEHNPVVLAKTIATLDYLSGGRVTLGAGVGWLKEEFEALGIPFEGRGRRTRECIQAMRKLWGDELSSFAGEFVNFSNVRSYPKPAQGGNLPVYFGGESVPALKRVADLGDGWCGANLGPAEVASRVKRLEELLRANGRKLSDVGISIMARITSPLTVDDLKRYRDAGANEVIMLSRQQLQGEADSVSYLEQIARNLVEPATKL